MPEFDTFFLHSFRKGSIIVEFRIIFKPTLQISQSTPVIKALNDSLAAKNYNVSRDGIQFNVQPDSLKAEGLYTSMHTSKFFI